VLHWRWQSPALELLLDRSHHRLPVICREIHAVGGELQGIKVQEVDLEDLYREFSH